MVCELYMEIILIRLSQFLLPPSPHAPLNSLSLYADGALYLQFKYRISIQKHKFTDKVSDTKTLTCKMYNSDLVSDDLF